ncbi:MULTISPECIES: CAF17-like 4Fe-4S cluster assembly/insertion protein YgfZ [Acinetobacter calcoaceticus/baumannii complex]|uniref:CAF17-like 4Fe-4S cluster assembly/insertion protein YgfZ n=1 Tax=Acinetobacter calcoaceticus/baumannii complex TaxID=909768 RepID=UPI00148C8814|nr:MULTISPECIES: folate-binding Fe/S cluster repair protein [Acinetobacter calcoaceticus/baumannii complex]QWZ61598.1 folate-binding Fe/S cluster repair protein [Acinetobacter pittii]
MSLLAFSSYALNGVDAQKFLQGQVTVDTERLAENETRYTAICDLKGRIHFGLWLKKINPESFVIVVTQDQAEEFAKHIKKYGAFSKMALSEQGAVFPKVVNHQTEFTTAETDISEWQKQAIMTGQAWITQATEHEFQPQELRLHQREGVNYDKGCYLGQEIVARLWFKAKPKHWLHLVQGTGEAPASATQLNNDIEVVNSIANDQGYLALVVAKPTALQELGLQVLELPEALSGDVARPQ